MIPSIPFATEVQFMSTCPPLASNFKSSFKLDHGSKHEDEIRSGPVFWTSIDKGIEASNVVLSYRGIHLAVNVPLLDFADDKCRSVEECIGKKRQHKKTG